MSSAWPSNSDHPRLQARGSEVHVTYAGAVRVLIVDGANVVGSRPNGWWRDRAGAAERLHQSITKADLGYDVVVLVLEGAAKRGWPSGETDAIHRARSGRGRRHDRRAGP